MTLDTILKIVRSFADRLPSKEQIQLVHDIEKSTIECLSEDESIFHFSLAGYDRPKYEGQRTYGLDGKMLDSDGVELDVILYCDQNDRLLELEFIRWDDNPLLSPVIETLEVY